MTAQRPAELRVLERTDEWIEVAHKYPLWTAVPATDRLTEELIRAKRAGYDSEYARERTRKEIDLLTNPRCVVASQKQEYNMKWGPCAQLVHSGDLCPRHGGDPKPATRVKALESEVARLRELLASAS